MTIGKRSVTNSLLVIGDETDRETFITNLNVLALANGYEINGNVYTKLIDFNVTFSEFNFQFGGFIEASFIAGLYVHSTVKFGECTWK